MEREIIERLAIDNALGELNEDAAVLFETYLAEHAEVRAWAESMAQTCLRAREAISSKTPSVEGSGPSPHAPRAQLALVYGRVLSRWAAVIAVALAIGVGLGRRSAPKPPAKPPTVVRAEQDASPKGWDRVLSESGDGFWQGKAVAMLQSKSYEVPHPRRVQAALWGRYRQSRKGHRDE